VPLRVYIQEGDDALDTHFMSMSDRTGLKIGQR
jgi:hypothetical protein